MGITEKQTNLINTLREEMRLTLQTPTSWFDRYSASNEISRLLDMRNAPAMEARLRVMEENDRIKSEGEKRQEEATKTRQTVIANPEFQAWAAEKRGTPFEDISSLWLRKLVETWQAERTTTTQSTATEQDETPKGLTTGTTVNLGPKASDNRAHRITNIETIHPTTRGNRKVTLVRIDDGTTWTTTIKPTAKRVTWNARMNRVITDAEKENSMQDSETITVSDLADEYDLTIQDINRALGEDSLTEHDGVDAGMARDILDRQPIQVGQIWKSDDYGTDHQVTDYAGNGMWEITGPVGNTYVASAYELRSRNSLDMTRFTHPTN